MARNHSIDVLLAMFGLGTIGLRDNVQGHRLDSFNILHIGNIQLPFSFHG